MAGRVAASVGAVALVTAAIFVLREGVPVLSLGVLYLFAVLPVAILWGLAYAIPVALLSMAAFNWFFLPPVHAFHLAEEENWFALPVYVVTAIVVSELAVRSRRRADDAELREREEALLAELSAALLQGRRIEDEVGRIADGIGELVGSPVRIELGHSAADAAEPPIELVAEGRAVGMLYVSRETRARLAARDRFLAALGSLLAVALDRERLAREALDAEALRRSDAIKTAVLRSVSHDLRTPLTAIRVAAEGLSSPALELTQEDRAALLDAILAETARLQRVVGDLLDLSRLQAGVARPDPDVWTLEELLSQSLAALGGGRERVDVDLPEDTPPVRVDAVQVERVLVNLVDNALKFSPPTSRVRVTVEARPENVVVRIVDDGPGLSEGELERVFEPFETGGVRDPRGNGLGLAIARGFAEANGGRVWAESELRGGATFGLALPIVQAPVSVGAGS